MVYWQYRSVAIGRTLLSLIFLISGVDKIIHWHGNADYMDSQGMSSAPFYLILAIALELGTGLAILFNKKIRLGATLLTLYLIPVTLIFHHFWDLTGVDRQLQMIQFLKNLAIMGGLLVLAATPAELEKPVEGRRQKRPAEQRQPLPSLSEVHR